MALIATKVLRHKYTNAAGATVLIEEQCAPGEFPTGYPGYMGTVVVTINQETTGLRNADVKTDGTAIAS